MDSDITCITYSGFLSLIASGSSNGTVSVWDFETGSLKVAFFSHKREITNLVFLEPFSVLFTSSKDGISCLWDCQDYNNLKTRCIGRLKNMS